MATITTGTRVRVKHTMLYNDRTGEVVERTQPLALEDPWDFHVKLDATGAERERIIGVADYQVESI